MFSDFRFIVIGLSIMLAALLSRCIAARTRIGDRRTAGGSERLRFRMDDYGRVIAARLRSRIAVADQLAAEADAEIARLKQLLIRKPPMPGPVPRRGPDILPRIASAGTGGATVDHGAVRLPILSAEQAQMIRTLDDAGYSQEQIASLIGRPTLWVERAMQRRPPLRRADAA
jgi:hypothetical protein